MKVIKLNRRYKMYKENRHQMGLRFNGWTLDAQRAEAALKRLTGQGGWNVDGDWYSYCGHTRSYGPRPFFITVKDEALLTAVLLSMQ